MIIRSFLPILDEGFLHNIADAAMVQMCPKCDEDPPSGCSKASSVMEERRNPNGLSSLSDVKGTKESSLSIVSKLCVPKFVYRRKNRVGGYVKITLDKEPVGPRRVGDSCLTICSAAHSVVEKITSSAPRMPSLDLDANPSYGSASLQEQRHTENGIGAHRIINVDSVNESCSSKSNAELVSVQLKIGTEESGECSSSSVIALETQGDTLLSERDICISILQSECMHERLNSSTTWDFEDGNEISTINSCMEGSRECKACGHSEISRKMLICDSCDEAFQLTCCHSQMRSFQDDDEWFCTSCLSKKYILVKQKSNTMRLSWAGTEVDGLRLAPSMEESCRIFNMLRDTELFKTNIRVGKGFQADVPNWTGPVKEDDIVGEPEELASSLHSLLHVHNFNKSSSLSSIGNWLQCKQVTDDGGETICGKWRRAPLFEVQTDDWECFCSVFWDPDRADCAVPQELDTDQVLKQLKYIEMLRTRLAPKRRKLVQPQASCSQQVIGAIGNTQK